MATSSAPRRCESCGCNLSQYNSANTCSPCRTATITATYRAPQGIRTTADLEKTGIVAYAMELDVDTLSALRIAVDNRLISPRFLDNADKLVRLIDTMEQMSHSEAARVLAVSRFTVANWRRRLGLPDPPSAEVFSSQAVKAAKRNPHTATRRFLSVLRRLPHGTFSRRSR